MGCEDIRQIVGSHAGFHQLLIIRALSGVADLDARILLHELLKNLIDCIVSLFIRIGYDLDLALEILALFLALCSVSLLCLG